MLHSSPLIYVTDLLVTGPFVEMPMIEAVAETMELCLAQFYQLTGLEIQIAPIHLMALMTLLRHHLEIISPALPYQRG
jgi:hypothetical protein